MKSKIYIILTSSFSNFPENSVIQWNLIIKRSDKTKPSYNKVPTLYISLMFNPDIMRNLIQWNLVIKRLDITKPSYNKVILLVPALYISLFFYPDIMRNLI